MPGTVDIAKHDTKRRHGDVWLRRTTFIATINGPNTSHRNIYKAELGVVFTM
jgi:hypothetical protein